MPTKRRYRGTLTPRTAKDGTVSFRARYTAPDGTKPSRTFTLKGPAEAWLTKETTRIDRGEWKSKAQLDRERLEAKRRAEAEGYTFGQWAEAWLKQERASRHRAESTLDTHETRLKNHITPAFRDRPLKTITAQDVRDWHADLITAKGWPVARNAYMTFAKVMHDAVEAGKIDLNPVNVPGANEHRPVRDRETVATPQQVAALADAMPERLRLSIYLMAYGQVRIGELRALRRGDFTTDYRAIKVRRQIRRTGTDPHQAARPKSKAGKRDVALPGTVAQQVREHILKFAAPGRDGLLFPSPSDPRHPLSEHTYRRHFTRARKAAIPELGPDFTPHSLRHTGLTLAGQGGATDKELMVRAGHSSPVMVMRYQHATRERDQLIADKLDAQAVVGTHTATVTPIDGATETA